MNTMFDHTKRLRSGRLLLESQKDKRPELAWYRRQDRSKIRERDDGEAG